MGDAIMLNKVKSSILPMLDTLGDAIGQYFSDPLENLLDDISQFTDVITAHVGEESVDVFLLSEALKQSLDNMDTDAIEQYYIDFCEAIVAIPIQFKVIFLPYYDDTWYSLESIYEAFLSDPQFVTEIIIIPIQRNTPSGVEHIYSNYLTPQGIPNTYYDDYDFSIDLPDIVFFNQPYDGVSYPKFQSKNIRPYAGMMVYVPYAMYLHEHVPVDKRIEHRNTWMELPGHNNADLIIAQGDSFVKSFTGTTRNGRKMVNLGSPIIDVLLNRANDGNWERHPEWEVIIEQRKTILLSTNYLSFFLGPPWYNETAPLFTWLLFLLESILVDEDLAIIWRPHPQTHLMANAMIGEHKAVYQECLRIADICDRIIIDWTSSAISAYMYCDAVISENSSTIAEAIGLGKPVFLVGMDYREYQSNTDNYYKAEYQNVLDNTRKQDSTELLLQQAIPSCGIRTPLKIGDTWEEQVYQLPIATFINDMKSNIDLYSDTRQAYYQQLVSNIDGTSGESILKYIKGLI